MISERVREFHENVINFFIARSAKICILQGVINTKKDYFKWFQQQSIGWWCIFLLQKGSRNWFTSFLDRLLTYHVLATSVWSTDEDEKQNYSRTSSLTTFYFQVLASALPVVWKLKRNGFEMLLLASSLPPNLVLLGRIPGRAAPAQGHTFARQ